MNKEELEFIAGIIEESNWLLYGDLDEFFDIFLKKVFSVSLEKWGHREVHMTPDFVVAYWLLISELTSLGLVEYGTSPRGAWFTEKGKRFVDIILKNENAIQQAVSSL